MRSAFRRDHTLRYTFWHTLSRRGLALAALAPLAFACASTQTVALDCIPEEATVYVDGRMLEEHPDELVLRSDEPHKIYVKAPGQQPQLIVLESVPSRDGGTELDRDRICLEPIAVGLDRELVLEVEEDPESAE